MTEIAALTPDRVSQDQRVEAILGAIRDIVQSQVLYRDVWRIFQTHNWQERLLRCCLRRVEDLVEDYCTNPTREIRRTFYRTIMASMRDAVIDCIENRARSRPGPCIAFFSPTKAFSGNFGNIAAELEAIGCHVMHFYGYPAALPLHCGPDEFILFGKMVGGVRGVDAMVTASIVDCLPDSTCQILVDHLSFADFGADHYDDVLWHEDILGNPSDCAASMIQKFGAYVSFFPLVDLHIAPTKFIVDAAESVARGLGYSEINGKAERRAKNADYVWRYLGKRPTPAVSTIVVGGYPKLDTVVARAPDVCSENIIVYAPTPNDKSGNKSGAQWLDFITINDYGTEVVRSLCEAFPDHRIVFKPHVDDFEDVIDRIVHVGSNYANFELSTAGSNYWDLYLRTKVLISDFSSTAYTFAFGTGHPVVFFSPNENRLGARREQNAYCRYRRDVGEIACDVDGLIQMVRKIFDEHEVYLQRVERFRERNSVNFGTASKHIAKEIRAFLDGNVRPHWKRYQAPDPAVAKGPKTCVRRNRNRITSAAPRSLSVDGRTGSDGCSAPTSAERTRRLHMDFDKKSRRLSESSERIIIFDSVEKTGGSSIKHLLRKNFSEDCFFDYDNGDPPSVTWRNYGIKCAVDGVPGSQEFFDNRGAWLARNHKKCDLQCVYGHGLWLGRQSILEILGDSEKDLVFARFLREPAERIASEYFYVLTNKGHPLHLPALNAGSLEGWFASPARPKDRQARGLLGSKVEVSGDAAFDLLMGQYEFFGLVEYMRESIFLMCKKLELDSIIFPHLNPTKSKKTPENFKSITRDKFYYLDEHDYRLYDKASPYFQIICKETVLAAE